MTAVVISGTGLFTPSEKINNHDLVESFNQYVEDYNQEHADAIASETMEPLKASSAEFIEKASGIKSRYVLNASGVLDPKKMKPELPKRSWDEPSYQCEVSVAAAKDALKAANKTPEDVDMVLVAASNFERPYPAIAVEVQNALGAQGFAFDLNVACSSATFALQTATDALNAGRVKCALVINSEICSAHLNYRDRDSHFIFGDAGVAAVLEKEDTCTSENAFRILGSQLKTKFSNNIRNDNGFLARTYNPPLTETESLFQQKGRKVFKEVIPIVAREIAELLETHQTKPEQIKRFWLHQANTSMNQLICKKTLGREATQEEAPIILDEYANTSSAGSMIAFHLHQDNIQSGDTGIICSFGAGYSVGTVLVEKV